MCSELLGDLAATHELARAVANGLKPGDVVGLVGELGVGKTEWTRGLLAALGAPASVRVVSPSYLLLNLYLGGRLPVAHFDAYFMQDAEDLIRAGLPELLAEGHVAVVEWADKVAEALPTRTLWLRLDPGPGPGSRRATLDRPPRPGPSP